MSELILGIDDAGRGPIIGPMVLAACLIDEETQNEFRHLGIKDSKQLTQKRREFLEEKIKEKAVAFEIVYSTPEEIDCLISKGVNLNDIEALKTAELINKINKGFTKIKVVIDCPSPTISNWKDFVKTKVENLSNLEVCCEHKADVNHIAVSAASILAKCFREREMNKLKEKYGDEIGSGYCSDPLTCRFLEKNGNKYSDHGIFRKSWITWKDAVGKREQKKLF